jgi:hypothetical protein
VFPLPVDLHRFPLIDDFAVALADAGEEGKHVEFLSARGGRLAGFPAWEHAERDLRHFDATDVPIGSIEDPFEDADDEWRIVIFEHRGHVYVLEGDSPIEARFGVYFRVPRDRYLQAWAAVIDAYNPIEPV